MTRRVGGKLRKMSREERAKRAVKQAKDKIRPARVWARRHVMKGN